MIFSRLSGLLVVALVLLELCTVSRAHGQSQHNVGVESELDLLLKIAREYRDGSADVPRNLDRAVHFFQYVLEQSKETTTTSAAAGSELYDLLLANRHLRSKYSRWQLLHFAAERGDAQAQHDLAAALGSGVHLDGIVPMDAVKALLLEYSAALSGHGVANMAMGYRFLNGIGVVASCDRALPHYEYAANVAVEYLESEVLMPSFERVTPSDFSSAASRTAAARRGTLLSRQDVSSELADYYAHLAEAGDVGAANILGSFYLHGTRSFPADRQKALYFLDMAAKMQHPQAAGLLGYFLARLFVKEDPSLHKGNYSLAQLFPTSRIVELLQLAEKKSDVHGIVGVGYIHEQGVGVGRNVTRALEMYHKCIHAHYDAGYFAAELRLRNFESKGSSHTRNHEVSAAVHAYSAASSLGNLLATHRVGHMAARGMGTTRSCETAVQAFKTVAERGPWMAAIGDALAMYRQRGAGSSPSASAPSAAALQSLWRLMPLAVAGVENAQFLAAFLLSKHAADLPVLQPAPAISAQGAPTVASDHNVSLLTVLTEDDWLRRTELSPSVIASLSDSVDAADPSKEIAATLAKWLAASRKLRRQVAAYLQGQPRSSTWDDDEDELRSLKARGLAEVRALAMLGLSASQGNADALVMLGDFHYYGSAALAASPARSAAYYQRAADLHHTQAIFNLGVMHEVGDGVAQDFHLAKRFYDLAASVDKNARLPRDLALIAMDLHRAVARYFGEDRAAFALVDRLTLQLLKACGGEAVLWLDTLSAAAADRVQRWMDSWKPASGGAIGQTLPPKQRFALQHYWGVASETLGEHVAALVKAAEKIRHVKTIVVEHDEVMMLAGLTLLFISLVLTKLLVRARELQLQRNDQIQL